MTHRTHVAEEERQRLRRRRQIARFRISVMPLYVKGKRVALGLAHNLNAEWIPDGAGEASIREVWRCKLTLAPCTRKPGAVTAALAVPMTSVRGRLTLPTRGTSHHFLVVVERHELGVFDIAFCPVFPKPRAK